MKALYPLRGIVTVLNTAFTAGNEIDYLAIRRHVQYALDAGVAGFLVPAMAAEVYQLTPTERIKMLETVLDEVNNRVPVIAGAGETDINKARALLKDYLRMGCKEVLFQIPYDTEEKFRNHFLQLAEIDPTMIMLQDWSSDGYGLPDHLICTLFEEVPAFRCLKVETVPAGIKYSRLLNLTEGRLNVSGGWAVTQLIEGLQRGVHAFMPTGMHYTYTRIYQLYTQGNISEAIAMFQRLLPILSFSNQHLDISIHFFKRLLHAQNIYPNTLLRGSRLEFDAIHEAIAKNLIAEAMKLEAENAPPLSLLTKLSDNANIS